MSVIECVSVMRVCECDVSKRVKERVNEGVVGGECGE